MEKNTVKIPFWACGHYILANKAILKHSAPWLAFKYTDVEGMDTYIYNTENEEMYGLYVDSTDKRFLADWKELTGEEY